MTVIRKKWAIYVIKRLTAERDEALAKIERIHAESIEMGKELTDASITIARMRRAIALAVEAIDGDDVISASEHLRAALGEEK